MTIEQRPPLLNGHYFCGWSLNTGFIVPYLHVVNPTGVFYYLVFNCDVITSLFSHALIHHSHVAHVTKWS